MSTSSSDESREDLQSTSSESEPEGDDESVGCRSRRKKGRRERDNKLSGKNGRFGRGGGRRGKNKKCVLDWGGEEEGEEEGTLRLVGCDGRVLSLAFGEVDDRVLLSGGTDGIIRLWQPYALSSWTLPASRNLDDSEDEEGGGALGVNGAKGGGGASGGGAEKGAGDKMGNGLGGNEEDARDQALQEGGAKGAGEDSMGSSHAEDSSLSSSRFEALGRKSRIQGSNIATPLCLYRAALAAVWSLDIGPFG